MYEARSYHDCTATIHSTGQCQQSHDSIPHQHVLVSPLATSCFWCPTPESEHKMLFSTTVFVQDRIPMEYCWAWYHDTQELHAIFNVFNNLFFTRCHFAELSNVHSRECVWSGWFEPTHFQGTVRAPTTQQPAVSRPCYLEKQVERWTTCARGSCVGAIHKLGSARAHSQAVQVEGKWTAIDHLRTFASSHGLRTRQSSTQSCSQVPHQREQVTSGEISTRGYPDAKSI